MPAAMAAAAAKGRHFPNRPYTTFGAGLAVSASDSACFSNSAAKRQSSAQEAHIAVCSTTSRSSLGGSSPRTADQIVSGSGCGSGAASAGAVNAARSHLSSWSSPFIASVSFLRSSIE
jgi:hypothetical protein